MRTRHLVGLISGVLILSVLLPVGLSIWLAHQQVETSFIEELNTYSSRVAIRANKVATQGKRSPSHGNASGILQLSLYSGSGLYR